VLPRPQWFVITTSYEAAVGRGHAGRDYGWLLDRALARGPSSAHHRVQCPIAVQRGVGISEAAAATWARMIGRWTLIGAVGVMSLVVIPREERYLERKFGGDYLTYKHSMRRWL
jgi:hypothetical protein